MPLIMDQKIIKEKLLIDIEKDFTAKIVLTEKSGKSSSKKFSPELLFRLSKGIIFSIAVILHIVLILYVTIDTGEKKHRQDNTIFKMVDVQEFIPRPPEVEKKPEPIKKVPPKPETQKLVTPQDSVAEEIIVTEKEVVETQNSSLAEETIEYLPQHKITEPPGIPTQEILANIKYPIFANKQRIEGVVFLELYIDQHGQIRNIKVLKDPGYGLAEAAIAALKGIVCKPAYAGENAVAVRFRYPVRFKLM